MGMAASGGWLPTYGVGYRALRLVAGYTTNSHSLVLTWTQRHTQGQRGGTVSPSPPGSEQIPPASSFSPTGTVISQRGCSRQQSSMSIYLPRQASPLLILCYVKARGPLVQHPIMANIPLPQAALPHSPQPAVYLLHAAEFHQLFSFLLIYCCHICLNKTLTAPKQGNHPLTSSVPSINSSSHRTESLA